MSLSSLIVQREVATMRQVEDALAHQVIHGGDLVTNLLEVAKLDEAALTPLLAASMNLGAAPAGELPRAPGAALALVPGELAARWSIVPLEVRNGRLHLAVAEPLTKEQESQLALVTGTIVVEQRAAPAVRVRQAIAHAYGASLDRRMEKLIARLSPPGLAGSLPPGGISAASPGAGPGAHLAGPTVPQAGGAPGQASRRVTAAGFPSAGPPSQSTPEPPPVAPSPGEGRAALLQRAVTPGPRVAYRRRGPITPDAARDAAEKATDRDELLDLFFDFSRQFFEYSALFLVHGDIAEGRDSFGVGAPPAKVLGIGVPLDLPSTLASARDERTPIVARYAGDGLDAVLLADLQRARDVEVAVVPLVVRTRTVAILIGDCGEVGVDRASLEQVARFAGAIGRAFERIIVRRKLEGFVAGNRAGGAGRIDASMVGEKRSVAPKTAVPGPGPMPAGVPAPAAARAAVRAPAPAPAAARAPAPVPASPSRSSWRPGPSPAPPPFANITAVRPLSSPPIPREEPKTPSPMPAIRPPEPIGEAPEVTAEFAETELFDELAWEAAAEKAEPVPDPEPVPAPPVSSAVMVPAHHPPVSRPQLDGKLPSVIVDLELEFGAMVDRVIAEQSEEAEGELLRLGERAMRVVMSRFPGPLTVERSRIAEMERPPRPSECGPVLRLVVRERKVALPFVIERLEDRNPEIRGWATHLLCELPYVEAIPHILRRLRDTDPATRVSAAHALVAVARPFPGDVREAVMGLAHALDPLDRAVALRVMSELRQPALVPEMVHALGDGDDRVVAAAHSALVVVTRQDFGGDARPWLRWWEQNAGRHRVEWLIDALAHETAEIRRGAAEELRAVSKEYFGYSGDLPPRDRERAQQRYRDWWITEGRARFKRI